MMGVYSKRMRLGVVGRQRQSREISLDNVKGEAEETEHIHHLEMTTRQAISPHGGNSAVFDNPKAERPACLQQRTR
jgi:hypothetical protein